MSKAEQPPNQESLSSGEPANKGDTSAGYSHITPEQDAEFDRLDRRGDLNNFQIWDELAAMPLVRSSVENSRDFEEPVIAPRTNTSPPPVARNWHRKQDGTIVEIDKRTLPRAGQGAADKKAPDYFPYKK